MHGSVAEKAAAWAERRRALGLAVAAPEPVPVPVAIVEKVPTSRVRAVRPRVPKAVVPVEVEAPVCSTLVAAPSRDQPRSATSTAPDTKPKKAAPTTGTTKFIGAFVPGLRITTSAIIRGPGDEPVRGLRDLAPHDHPTHADLRGDKQRELGRLAAAGDKHAMSTLLVANDGFVLGVAKRSLGYASDPEGLIQACRMAFMHAVTMWDPDVGSLTTYAFHWIRQAAWRYIADCEGDLSVPVNAGPLGRKAARLGATSEEEAIQLTGKKTAGAAWSARIRAARLDAPIGDDADATTFGDLTADTNPDQGERLAAAEAQAQRVRLVHEILAAMPERQADILRRRFLSENQETLDDIGASYDLSRERVRQIEVMAVNQFRLLLAERADDEDADSLWGGWGDQEEPVPPAPKKAGRPRKASITTVKPTPLPPRKDRVPTLRLHRPGPSPARLAVDEILAHRPLAPPTKRRTLGDTDP